MGTGHSFLPPSGAAAWVKCPAWCKMQADFPEEETESSAEGTAAHWVATEMIEGVIIEQGATAPNGVIVTDEMIEGAQLFFNAVMSIARGSELHVEETIGCEYINPICYGTPDVWTFQPQFAELHVFDYKFGHEFVDEFENVQLTTYTAGILDKLAREIFNKPVGQIDQFVRVHFHIVQPRCFYKGAPVRSWQCYASDLRGTFNILRAAAIEATSENPTAKTNAECRHCSGRHACAALQRAAYSDAEFATAPAVFELSPESASLELRMFERALDRLQARTESLREVVLSHIKTGATVPHWKTTTTAGRVVWKESPDVVAALGDLFGVDLRKSSLVTPTQALKLGIDEAVISGYTAKQSGSIKLEAVNNSDARRVFGNN